MTTKQIDKEPTNVHIQLSHIELIYKIYEYQKTGEVYSDELDEIFTDEDLVSTETHSISLPLTKIIDTDTQKKIPRNKLTEMNNPSRTDIGEVEFTDSGTTYKAIYDTTKIDKLFRKYE